jgi:TPR repeat protein
VNDPVSGEDRYAAAKKLLNRRRFSEAFSIYRDLAAVGDPRCLVFLGWMYDRGVGVARDSDKAYECYKSAALLGYKEGAFYCGRRAATVCNYEEALEWFGKAAVQDYGPALLWLGIMHLKGQGVPKDIDKAVRYLERAAKTGNFLARRELAVLMLKGRLGISRIPIGLIMFPLAIFLAFLDAARHGYTDRLIG